MMEAIKIVYIDDTPDVYLSKYLDNISSYPDYKDYCFETVEIIFNPANDYSSLLHDEHIRTANIIIIDSRLFENRTATSGKFTGEEFKFILQKFYSYIEVIVITQNENESGIEMVAKYVKNQNQTADDYYAEVMPPYLNTAIDKIIQYRILAERVNQNQSWERVLKEKVLGTLQGTLEYNELSKSDIDTLICAFREIRKCINDEGL